MTVPDYLSIALAVLFPLLATVATGRRWMPQWCSTIILCYGAGILVSNLRLWTIDSALLEGLAGAGMLIGLPLLLFSVRIKESVRYARSMLLSFGLCCLAGLLCTGTVGMVLAERLPDSWQVAGMLTGLYTGGTPNVQAIGLALEAPADYLVLIQAADVILGGAYLIGLITFLPGLYARFYPPTPDPLGGDAGAERLPENSNLQQRILQLFAGVLVTVLAVGLSRLLTGVWLHPTVLILLVTTVSLLVTLTPLVERIGDSYPLGEYFVLIFCVALGMLADFRELASKGLDLLYFSAIALTSTTLLHLVLSRLFRIDRDTVILSSVAAFYGPVFVVQVAAAIRNRHLLAAGIAVSLIGFGVGNYLGIGLGLALRWLGG